MALALAGIAAAGGSRIAPTLCCVRMAKGAGDHEGRPYGFRVLPLDGRSVR